MGACGRDPGSLRRAAEGLPGVPTLSRVYRFPKGGRSLGHAGGLCPRGRRWRPYRGGEEAGTAGAGHLLRAGAGGEGRGRRGSGGGKQVAAAWCLALSTVCRVFLHEMSRNSRLLLVRQRGSLAQGDRCRGRLGHLQEHYRSVAGHAARGPPSEEQRPFPGLLGPLSCRFFVWRLVGEEGWRSFQRGLRGARACCPVLGRPAVRSGATVACAPVQRWL